ncbi:hypothetical protein ACFL2U_03975, partial [Patescibacteria group bacterium]
GKNATRQMEDKMKKAISLVLIGSLVFMLMPVSVLAKGKTGANQPVLETMENEIQEEGQNLYDKKWKEMTKQEKTQVSKEVGLAGLIGAAIILSFILHPPGPAGDDTKRNK